MRILPGNPALILLGEQADPEAVKVLEEKLGLNKPIYIQFYDFWAGLITGNLGRSLRTGVPVTSEILSRLPTTLELAIGGLIGGNLLTIIIGTQAARRSGSALDNVIRVYSLLGYCIPIFWLGLLFQLCFGIYLNILPIQGNIDLSIPLNRITGLILVDSLLTGNLNAFISGLQHYLLPWLVLSIYYSSTNSRVLRARLVEILAESFILTAKAKGLDEGKIVYRHALRHAIIPMLTLMGMQFADLLCGAVLTETVFNLPGMGRLLYQSVLGRDYPMVQGLIVWFSIIISVTLIFIDLLVAYVDPRVKY
jgi:peptide/nickel transport system permease protein